jgi:hypothetical protein
MTNDQYLIVSYFAVAALAIVLAGGVWLYLRRSFCGITQALSTGILSQILKVIFPAGLFLPALLGFVSVTYFGCGHLTYEEITKFRWYLIGKNQEQISTILLWTAAAVLFWDFIILLVLRFERASSRTSGEPADIRLP